MASTTEQRMALESAVVACLEAEDDPDEVKGVCEDFVDDWVTENKVDDEIAKEEN